MSLLKVAFILDLIFLLIFVCLKLETFDFFDLICE